MIKNWNNICPCCNVGKEFDSQAIEGTSNWVHKYICKNCRSGFTVNFGDKMGGQFDEITITNDVSNSLWNQIKRADLSDEDKDKKFRNALKEISDNFFKPATKEEIERIKGLILPGYYYKISSYNGIIMVGSALSILAYIDSCEEAHIPYFKIMNSILLPVKVGDETFDIPLSNIKLIGETEIKITKKSFKLWWAEIKQLITKLWK